MDLTEFFDGTRRPVELAGFLDRLPVTSRYHTARANDVEMYEAAERAGMRPRKAAPPEMYEYSRLEACLAAVFEAVQKTNHLLANQHARKGRRQRFKPVPWPAPRSAADTVRRRRARRAFEIVESSIRFVDPAEYEAMSDGGMVRDN